MKKLLFLSLILFVYQARTKNISEDQFNQCVQKFKNSKYWNSDDIVKLENIKNQIVNHSEENVGMSVRPLEYGKSREVYVCLTRN
jgi:hypothetical protein